MLLGNFHTILSYFAEAAVEAPGYGLVEDEALPLNMIRAIMDNKWGDVTIEFKWKPETFSHCSAQYRRQVNSGRFILEPQYDARLALFAFLEKNGFEVPCPYESFVRKTRINFSDYESNRMDVFGYWGMMSLALSRFEFSNNKFTVYLAVPPFIPKTGTSGKSFYPDHLFLFGLESYSSTVYSEQVKTILNQAEEFLCGQNSSFDEELILSDCGKVLQRQQRLRPIQFNILPWSSSIWPLHQEAQSSREASLPKSPEKPKSFKGRINQAERSRARKLKRRQEIQADLDAKRKNTPPKSLAKPQKEIQKDAAPSKPSVIETTDSKTKSQVKKRPKTHFRKTKKPGRA